MARPPIMHRRTPAAAVALLLGLAGAGVLLLLMGVGKPGAQFLGVPMGREVRPTAKGDWLTALKAAASEKGVVEWQIEDNSGTQLGWERDPRRNYCQVRIKGTRDSEQVTADVLLVALDGQGWTLKEWVER